MSICEKCGKFLESTDYHICPHVTMIRCISCNEMVLPNKPHSCELNHIGVLNAKYSNLEKGFNDLYKIATGCVSKHSVICTAVEHLSRLYTVKEKCIIALSERLSKLEMQTASLETRTSLILKELNDRLDKLEYNRIYVAIDPAKPESEATVFQKKFTPDMSTDVKQSRIDYLDHCFRELKEKHKDLQQKHQQLQETCGKKSEYICELRDNNKFQIHEIDDLKRQVDFNLEISTSRAMEISRLEETIRVLNKQMIELEKNRDCAEGVANARWDIMKQKDIQIESLAKLLEKRNTQHIVMAKEIYDKDTEIRNLNDRLKGLGRV
jgi:chromosome segregation ATPase